MRFKIIKLYQKLIFNKQLQLNSFLQIMKNFFIKYL